MPHKASVHHHVKGRIRVRVPSGKRNLAVLTEIAQSLGSVPGIRSIQTNAVTGSILLEYDHVAHPQFHDALQSHGANTGLFTLAPPEVDEVDKIAADIEREAEFLAQHSDTARVIVDGFKKLNNGLRRATHNNVDLKVLLPLGLAAWAVVEHDPEIATPLWLTLGIFSFNSFVALHGQPEGVAVQAQQTVSETPEIRTVDIRQPRPRSRKRT